MGNWLQDQKEGVNMTCFYCKGDMTKGFTTHFVDLGTCIIIIKNVPCLKCSQCGEVAYTGTVVKQLERIVNSLKASLTEIAVVTYSDNAA